MNYKDLRNIQETYNAMYSEEVVDEDVAGMVDKATKAGQNLLKKVGVKINRTARPTATPSTTTSNTMRQNQSSMEEVDVFDIVKGHLMSEGYADTEEAALAIMANMSEEWRQSIIEEVDAQGNRSHDLFTGKANSNYKPGNAKPKPKPQVKKEAPMRDKPLW